MATCRLDANVCTLRMIIPQYIYTHCDLIPAVMQYRRIKMYKLSKIRNFATIRRFFDNFTTAKNFG